MDHPYMAKVDDRSIPAVVDEHQFGALDVVLAGSRGMNPTLTRAENAERVATVNCTITIQRGTRAKAIISCRGGFLVKASYQMPVVSRAKVTIKIKGSGRRPCKTRAVHCATVGHVMYVPVSCPGYLDGCREILRTRGR